MTAKVVNVTNNGYTYRMPVFSDATLYAGNLMTVSRGGYVKHYFAENERILSNVSGGGRPSIDPDKELKLLTYENAKQFSDKFTNFARHYFSDIANMNACVRNDIEYPADLGKLPNLFIEFKSAVNQGRKDKLYYFHSNHLGSGSLITDKNGQTYQTLAYAPYGEDLVNIRQTGGNYDEPYKYSGKIKDEESGLHYFDARYLWDAGGIFTSADPRHDERPNESPYSLCGNNPINRVDEDGEFWNYVAGAVVGAAVEYGSQVVGNVIESGFRVSAFTDNIDLIDIAVAAGEGALTSGGSAIKSVAAKTTVKVVSSVAKNTVDTKTQEGGGIKAKINSAGEVVQNTAIDMAGEGVSKVVPKIKNVNIAKETTKTKAVNTARQKATSQGRQASVGQLNNVRKSVPARNTTSRGVNKTISESTQSAASGVSSQSAKSTIKKTDE
jgi:RHS repeat-associated protein